MGFFSWLLRRAPAPPDAPMGISLDSETGASMLRVRYHDYPEWDTLIPTEDPWRRHRSVMLRLAFQTAAGAELVNPKVVAVTRRELSDDVCCEYEFRVPPTPANVTALLASGLSWTTDAAEVARRMAIPDATVAATRERMRTLTCAEMAAINQLLGRPSDLPKAPVHQECDPPRG